MRTAFKYRIYPTKAQQTNLLRTLDECRWVYNQMLEQRVVYHDEFGLSVSYYAQKAWLPTLKAERPSLRDVHSQVLQDIPMRLELAFQAFFRRATAGEKPGYPRFRGQGRYNSVTYPQYGNGAKLTGDKLHLSKIGTLQVVLHRPLEGTPKTVTITRSSTGKWYVCLSCEWAPVSVPVVSPVVGIDVGLARFATLSTGEQLANPRFFRDEEKALARAQGKHAQWETGRAPRRQHRRVVARGHERIKFRRSNFAHQHSRRIVDTHQVIAVEDMTVNRLIRRVAPKLDIAQTHEQGTAVYAPNGQAAKSGLNKSISDAAWTQFTAYLAYKAAWAGRHYIAVNPAYISQDCSRCGHRQKRALSERSYTCPVCDLELDRDHNAALNILALGLQRIGSQSIEAPGFSRGE